MDEQEILDTEELEDFELEKTECSYEIWLLGYDEDNFAMDFTYQIDDFDSLQEAQKCFEYFSSKENIDKSLGIDFPEEAKHVSIQLETVCYIDGEWQNVEIVNEAEVF